jgi:hypothetical protein
VGSFRPPGATEYLAMRWTALGGPESLGCLPGDTSSMAWAASNDGETVVGYSGVPIWDPPFFESVAFRWSRAEGMQALALPEGLTQPSIALETSRDGTQIVGWANRPDRTRRGVCWIRGGEPVVLEPTEAYPSCSAVCISGDGSRIAGLMIRPEGEAVAIWDECRQGVTLDALLSGTYGLELGDLRLVLLGGARSVDAMSERGDRICGTGVHTSSGEVVGFLAELPPACYVNCDLSSVAPILSVLDFNCFLNAFAGGSPYANCDKSTAAPTLNVLDFNCFLNRFAAGCP